ncbi:fibrinogen c domain-containing protein 1 [Plakobranchus ocellatus]|uniref:Fibrinogen c domain-containing protein 1 n=1 Tax=Plakobranchus ocellatus TaxID=259542 RepID=A0AAV4DUL2_9GAST|nr:fibrinogen c domain-containing protein 1 [Plakobranchus ocellatus]
MRNRTILFNKQKFICGLELTLHLNSLPLTGTYTSCGVLTCVESHPASNTSLARVDSDSSDPPSHQSTSIKSLKLFQLETNVLNGNSHGRQRRLVASVTSQQSRLTRMANGLKIDGRLEAGLATLRLELTKQDDCLANFICQSQAEDVEGNQFESKAQVLQHPRQSIESGGDSLWKSVSVLALLQQLDTKLERLENDIDSLKHSIDHDVDSIKTDLNSKVDRLEDKIQSIGKDLITQSNRLEDKIESQQKNTNSKIERFEEKVESCNDRIADKVESFESYLKDNLKDKLDSNADTPAKRVNGHLKLELLSLNNKISTVKTAFEQFEMNIASNMEGNFVKINQKLRVLKKNTDMFLNNQTQCPQSSENEISDECVDTVTIGLTKLENKLQAHFDELSSNIDVSTAETQPIVNRSVSHANLDFEEELKAAFTHALTPKACYRGMLSVAATKPYIVIEPNDKNKQAFPVLCDTTTDGGGWIVIQRRTTGSLNFYRGWEDYKKGFGSLDGDFWLGNEKIHSLTGRGGFELRVDLRYNGNSAFAHYEDFSVGDEVSNYALSVKHYDGTAGDSLTQHNGKRFSTRDRDNDEYNHNCAELYTGAWWYKGCHYSNLNGMWNEGNNKGPRWNSLTNANAASYTEMKVRRVISVLS